MGVRDVYFVLFKHKWRIVLYFTIIAVGALLFSFLWPPTYESASRILMEKTTSTISDPSLFPLQTTSLLRTVTGNEEANNEIQIALSRPVLEKVVSELNLKEPFQPPPPQGVLATIHAVLRRVITFVKGLPRWILQTLHVIGQPTEQRKFDKAVNKLAGDLKLRQISDSDVLMFGMKGWYPEQITRIVNAVTRDYLDFHLRVHQGSDAQDFYGDHLQTARTRLEGLEKKLASYRRDEDLVNYDKAETVVLEKIEILEREQVNLRKQIITERAKIGRMQASLSKEPDLLIPSADLNSLDSIIKIHDRLVEKRLERGILLEHYTADHPRVQALDKEVTEIQTSLREEVRRIVDLEQNQLATWEDEEKAIEQAIDGLQVRAAELPEKKLALTQIQRDIDESKGLYEQLLKKREDARLNLALDPRMVKVRPITLANVPTEQEFPDLFMNMILALSLGPVAAIALAFLIESLSHTFRNKEEVQEHLGVPLLATLPNISSRPRLKIQGIEPLKGLKHMLDEGARSGGTDEAGGTESGWTGTRAGGEAPRTILFAAVRRGEGASTVASLYAEALAEYGHERVLLIDGDVPAPSLHKFYGVSADRGLLDLFRGRAKPEEVVFETRVKGLSLLPGVNLPGGTAGQVILEPGPLGEALAVLRSRFDVIVMDGAALGVFADTARLASVFDATVLVVEFDRTGWHLGEEALDLLRRCGARVAGVVLNRVRSYIPRALERRL